MQGEIHNITQIYCAGCIPANNPVFIDAIKTKYVMNVFPRQKAAFCPISKAVAKPWTWPASAIRTKADVPGIALVGKLPAQSGEIAQTPLDGAGAGT